MITLFTVPRAFEGQIDLIQQNALLSWKLLPNSPQIIVLGDEIGNREICNEYEIDFIPNVKTSIQGTPLVNDIFKKAQEQAFYDIMAFVNTDIILMKSFVDAVIKIINEFKNFLLIGQKHDIELRERIDFEDNLWEKKLIDKVELEGKLHAPCGIDYHVFRKGNWLDLPPFVIGRSSYDCWITAQSIKKGDAVIDGTKFIYAIHQKHKHKYLKDGRPILEGLEAKNNRELGGSDVFKGFVSYATWKMTNDGLIKKRLGNN